VRKTVNRETIVEKANAAILHLSDSNSPVDRAKREAIFSIASITLIEADSYAGYRYLNSPTSVTVNGYSSLVYDESRVALY
jgi:hypothetical protein